MIKWLKKAHEILGYIFMPAAIAANPMVAVDIIKGIKAERLAKKPRIRFKGGRAIIPPMSIDPEPFLRWTGQVRNQAP